MPYTTLFQTLFGTLGLGTLGTKRLVKPAFDFVGHQQHHASPDRKAWRALKRAKGARQARMERKAERRAAREVVQ